MDVHQGSTAFSQVVRVDRDTGSAVYFDIPDRLPWTIADGEWGATLEMVADGYRAARLCIKFIVTSDGTMHGLRTIEWQSLRLC